MKKHKKNIWLLIIIVIGGIIFFCLGKRNYDVKLVELKERARKTFIEALDQELRQRNVEAGLTLYIDPKKSLKSNVFLETVTIESGSGKREDKLNFRKYYLNVTNNTNLPALHGYVFERNPIIPDSINAKWKLHLMKTSVNIQNTLYIPVTEKDEMTISDLTTDRQWCNDSNAIFESYIRYHCEIEIVRFLNYSIWRIIGLSGFMYFVLYLIFICGSMKIVFAINKKINPAPKIEIREIPVIQEIPITHYVKETKLTSVRSYRLRDEVIFHAGQKKISINGEEKKMTPQVSMLLELFLNASNYALTDDEIFNELWSDRSGTPERLHQVITRLRRLLSNSSIYIERHGNSSYQLIVE